jgi:K+-sensing histidine kinase KdpD
MRSIFDSASCAARSATGIVVQVQDTGVGIFLDEIANLFQKYQQSASKKTSEDKGTGLGLVISKMIVKAHRGRIWVESEKEKARRLSLLCLSMPTPNRPPVAKLRYLRVEHKDPDTKILTADDSSAASDWDFIS